MNFQDFKDIHQKDTPVEKLNLLVSTLDIIGSCRVSYVECPHAKGREHYIREIEGQKERANWLYGEIKAALQNGKASIAVE